MTVVADWAWPSASVIIARALLVGGPFDGETADFVPPDLAAPAQIVWSGWFPWGFGAYLYEWRGERTLVGGRADTLVYRPTGRRLASTEIPPLIAETADVWAGSTALIAEGFDIPPELLWPSVCDIPTGRLGPVGGAHDPPPAPQGK